MYPGDYFYYNKAELDEIIESRIEYFNRMFKPNAKILDETEAAAALEPNFLVKYGLTDSFPLTSFNVNCFLQLGIDDPFPEDDEKYEGSLDDVDPSIFQLPKTPTDLVYQQGRFIEGFSPYCVYIPRKEIMFKIMRACMLV